MSGDGCDSVCEVDDVLVEEPKEPEFDTVDEVEEVVAVEKEEEPIEVVFEIAECGNGVLEEGERCDDGNAVDNDGCSYRCRIEPRPVVAVPVEIVEEKLQDDESVS